MEQNGNEGLEIVNISGNQLQPDEKYNLRRMILLPLRENG